MNENQNNSIQIPSAGPGTVVRSRPGFIHRCSCGEAYTLAAWKRLPGPASGQEVQDMTEVDDLEPSYLWMKNCPICHTTMAVELDRNGQIYEEE